MKVSFEDLDLVENYIWCESKGRNVNTWDGEKRIAFHQMVLPCKKPLNIDHIKRDKLDNRRSNLRCVNSSVQMINRKKGEIAGVHSSPTKKCWRAQWRDGKGKKCSKTFSVTKYGYDQACQMAINVRLKIEAELENYTRARSNY